MACVAGVVAAVGLKPDTELVTDIRTGKMGAENPNSAGPIEPPRVITAASLRHGTSTGAGR